MNPLVSIASITYNHEQYIAQAIESWLMQKTDFDIEIVIGEDCSTDDTRRIIEEYRLKHPDLIRVITSETNVGMMPNFIRTLEVCRGKYIALCEGDDYWTDPLKLQKQVDFLEGNEEYTVIGHKSKRIKENDIINEVYQVENPLLIDNWIGKLPFRTNTMVFKKEKLNLANFNVYKFISGDRIILAFLLLKGKGFFLDEYLSVYRDHTDGISKSLNLFTIKKNEIQLYKELNRLTKMKYKTVLFKNIFSSYKHILEGCWEDKLFLNWFLYLLISTSYIRTKTDLKIFLKEYLFQIH